MHVRVERGDRVERALHLAGKDDTPHQEGASCHGVSYVVVGVAPVGQHMRRDERERITHCIIRCRVEVLIGLRVRQFGRTLRRRWYKWDRCRVCARGNCASGVSHDHSGSPVRRSPVRRSVRFLEATGSRKAAMMRAACTSSTVRSGISEPAKGNGISKPSPARRGMTCTW